MISLSNGFAHIMALRELRNDDAQSFCSGMKKIRCASMKRRKPAVLESALLRGPISWMPPRAMKCLWKGDTASHLPDAAQSTISIEGRQLDPEGSREKTEYQIWSKCACSPPSLPIMSWLWWQRNRLKRTRSEWKPFKTILVDVKVKIQMTAGVEKWRTKLKSI